MNSLRNLHVLKLDKFIPPYIDFIRNNFPDARNFFYTIGDSHKYSYEESHDSFHQENKIGYARLIFWMHRSDKIIIHSLFDPYVVFILFLFPWLTKKSYWVMWGGDYIESNLKKATPAFLLKRTAKKRVIRNVRNLVTFMPGSVEMVRSQYGATGRHRECLAYTSNIYGGKAKSELARDDMVRVLVGNSANPTNRHFEIFRKIAPIIDDRTLLYVPLSYGDSRYASSVIENGKKLFGDQFIPMTELLPADEYKAFLSSLDVAVFNHSRQQAMGTTINLLGMGVAVYMPSNLPSWHFLTSKGIKLRDIRDLNRFDDLFFEPDNEEAVKSYFSEDNLRAQWERILYE